ncbi:hypothetical protein GQ43DRAFT_445421 [Delitschia confertaspora ATCC 74209]|uniref:Uncharacterized protein n=1 Tax=Delitschia confertaspora ATCC 74209 TaxID=1513339 RepID=A0A9P4JAS5_9PLEO|nr:hypothetical protein GQ43DRAFT_445421 [Delitschia confertaspora ATCC 74209]
MTSHWAQTQREGWLCDLYGKDSGDGTRKLPNKSVQSQLVSVLDNLLSGKSSPKESAAKTASLIMSQENVDIPWNNLLGLYLDAVEKFADEKDLKALVDYIVELASLPDAVNEGPETKTLDVGGKTLRIEPGQAVVFEEGTLWRDLPRFSSNVTESFQGPERYLTNLRPPVSPGVAKATWRNLNTYIALIAKSTDAQRIPVLARQVGLGLKTMAMALEYSPDTRLGKNIELHAPAAAQWLRIAGDEIDRLCRDGTQRMAIGDLWAGSGGSEVCDSARLQFWRARIVELGY